jgi:glyoxylase-like metal-dependent hydrolase (beta-lactamase superfamily II)
MLDAFHESTMPPNMSVNILYLDTGEKRILVDTGIAHHNPEGAGVLLDTLRAEGIAPGSINTIILTHFHLDHIGGLLGADGKPNFPNARLVTAKREYNYVMNEVFLVTIDPKRAQIFRDTFAAYPPPKLIEGEAEVEAGVCLVPAPGHTPGHSGVMLESEGEWMFHVADAVHHTFQLNHADAIPRSDVLPEVAIATRQAIFERAVNENLRMMTYHFPFPGVGHIQRGGDGFGWISV